MDKVIDWYLISFVNIAATKQRIVVLLTSQLPYFWLHHIHVVLLPFSNCAHHLLVDHLKIIKRVKLYANCMHIMHQLRIINAQINYKNMRAMNEAERVISYHNCRRQKK